MDIERKWMVKGWPQGLVPGAEYEMEQGYLSERPTVRIRKEAKSGGETESLLCVKGKGGLVGWPLIPKLRRDYPLPGGLKLEVSRVDEGAPTEFWYAEVEFESEAAALSWQPAQAGLEEYLRDEVTGQPGQSMGEYGRETRGAAKG